jgi:hypothetical protein
MQNVVEKPLRDAFDLAVDQDISIIDIVNPAAAMPSSRVVNANWPNPFNDNAVNRVPHLPFHIALPKDGELNGYLKITFRKQYLVHGPGRNTHHNLTIRPKTLESHIPTATISTASDNNAQVRNALESVLENRVLRTPNDFGLGCTLSNIDHKLFRFCGLIHPCVAEANCP